MHPGGGIEIEITRGEEEAADCTPERAAAAPLVFIGSDVMGRGDEKLDRVGMIKQEFNGRTSYFDLDKDEDNYWDMVNIVNGYSE